MSRHTKTNIKKSKTNMKSKNKRRQTKKRIHARTKQIVPIFSDSQQTSINKIVNNEQHNQTGNMIPGLRNFIKNDMFL